MLKNKVSFAGRIDEPWNLSGGQSLPADMRRSWDTYPVASAAMESGMARKCAEGEPAFVKGWVWFALKPTWDTRVRLRGFDRMTMIKESYQCHL